MKFVSAAEMYDPGEPTPGRPFNVDRFAGGSAVVNTAASRVGKPDYRLLFDQPKRREPAEYIAARLVDRSGDVLEEWPSTDLSGSVWVPRYGEWKSGLPQPGWTVQVQVRYRDSVEPVWEDRIRFGPSDD